MRLKDGKSRENNSWASQLKERQTRSLMFCELTSSASGRGNKQQKRRKQKQTKMENMGGKRKTRKKEKKKTYYCDTNLLTSQI